MTAPLPSASWEVVVFNLAGKANHCGIAVPERGFADNSLLGARVVPWTHGHLPKGERLHYPIHVPDPAAALAFLEQPGQLCAPILAQERRHRGWHLTMDAPDFVRTLRVERSLDPEDMNCVEWIVRALEVGGVAVPRGVLTPTDLRYWCVAGFPGTDPVMMINDVRTYADSIDMMALLAEIGPLPRTLACRATDTAYDLLKAVIPEGEVEGYPSGTAAWSWTIPERWELIRAVVKDGERVVLDSNDNHLHCLNYSEPFKGRVTREELLAHLHSYPARPNAIPFMFSFYDRKWALCLQHERVEQLTADFYDVDIDCRREDGEFRVMSAYLPGESASEFLICANICHPGQVNDSLTGLAVGADIFRRLAARPSRKYSYRFLVVPETIGSIAYMSRHPEVMQRSVGGFFSEMLGTDGPMVLQATRRGDTYWDHISRAAIAESGFQWKGVPFMKSASNDEKCLDAPGVNIPMFSITRYPYPEYHSDDDNLSLIDVARLRESRDVLQRAIDLAEGDYVPVLTQPGPVFLSGHGLMPERDDKYASRMAAFYDVMYALDGRLSVVQTARAIARPVTDVMYWTEAFAAKGLLEKRPFVVERT
jgi:aminopeptidase-like protein